MSKGAWQIVFEQIPEGTKMRVNEDDDYWYYNLPPTMLGAIYDLMPPETEKPKRRFFNRRKVQVAVKKEAFGFIRELDEENG